MKSKESKSMLEVLEWKEEAYREVEHLDLKKALKNRILKSVDTTNKLGFKTVSYIHK